MARRRQFPRVRSLGPCRSSLSLHLLLEPQPLLPQPQPSVQGCRPRHRCGRTRSRRLWPSRGPGRRSPGHPIPTARRWASGPHGRHREDDVTRSEVARPDADSTGDHSRRIGHWVGGLRPTQANRCPSPLRPDLGPSDSRLPLHPQSDQRSGPDGDGADLVGALMPSRLAAPLPLARGEHLPAAPLIGYTAFRHPASYLTISVTASRSGSLASISRPSPGDPATPAGEGHAADTHPEPEAQPVSVPPEMPDCHAGSRG